MNDDMNFINAYFSAPCCNDENNIESSSNEVTTALPSDATVTMAYVPFQFMSETYDEEKALMNGTLFPDLNKPFYGKCVY